MASAGVSIITGGKLLDDDNNFPIINADASPIINARAANGYHLLVVEGRSRARGSICSQFFIIGGQYWRIYFHPHADGSLITLQLCLVNGTVDPVKAYFEFSFVEETDKQERARIYGGSKIFEFRGRYDHHKRVLKTEFLEKFVRDDSFTIRCDVMVLGEDVLPTTTSSFIAVPPSDMQQNFMNLLLVGEGTDVIFGVGGETFAAHRCILAARSAVFRALLFGPMKEGTSTAAAVVQIDDMDAAVFKAMLEFIYGDRLPVPPADDDNEGVFLQHLLIAADRYDLRRLRAMCEKKLCEYIDIGSAATILALADQHGCEGMKIACYRFLDCPANLRAVVETEEFDHLKKSCPSLMKEISLSMLPSPSLIQ